MKDYLLYLLAFPKLIAGPIVRFQEVADEVLERKENIDEKLIGFYRFLIGLAKNSGKAYRTLYNEKESTWSLCLLLEKEVFIQNIFRKDIKSYVETKQTTTHLKTNLIGMQ